MGLNLVCGGSGYFGTVLVRILKEKGEDVRIFDLNDAYDKKSDIEFLRGDIRDKNTLEKAFDGVSTVYNTAAQVPLAKNKKLFYSVNVNGAENLFDLALKHKIKKVIHLSSSAVFGIPQKNPVDESILPNPMEDYGRAKYEAEKIAQKYFKKGLNITLIRPRTILGDGRLGIFSILFKWVKEGINIPVLGDGKNRYQFVHAQDLAGACILAAQEDKNEIYNIGALKFGTMRELLEDLIKHAKSSSKIVSVPPQLAMFCMKLTSLLRLSPLTDYHTLMYGREMYFDLTKPIKELNWQPQYSNAQMICESYDWYCKNYNEIQKRDLNGSLHKKQIKEGALSLVRYFLR